MQLRVLDDLGAAKLSEISKLDLQAVVDGMLRDGFDPSTIRNTIMPLRALFRRATGREIVINPTAGLELPAVRGKRGHIATPEHAAALIAALPESERALRATAFYAGLRLGELQALRDSDIDLATGVIRVERSWDKVAGPIAPKSRAGVRAVPIISTLRVHLAERRLRGRCQDFFFGDGGVFNDDTARARATKAWKLANLESVGFQDARHTYASLCIAAGVNAKALSTYMGHSSITITLDRYGHLFPGNENEAAGLLDSYLAGASAGAQSVPMQL